MNNNVVDSIIASIIFAILSTGLGLVLQALGLSVQASVLVALFALLILMILFISAKSFYPVYVRRLAERQLEKTLNVNDPNDPEMQFKRKIIERVLRENPGFETKGSTWIREYPNQETCEYDIQDAFRQAKKVKILTIRGKKYFLGGMSLFYNLYQEKRTKNLNFSVKVLVLSPESPHVTNELAQDIGQYSAKQIKSNMETVLDVLKDFAKENKNFEVRCYDETPNFKVLLFDDVMFVSAFTEPKNDRNAKMLRITREGTPLFRGLEKHFDDLWKRSFSGN